MQFNSLYFILFFLPVTLAVYYLVSGAGSGRTESPGKGSRRGRSGSRRKDPGENIEGHEGLAQKTGMAAVSGRERAADWTLIAASFLFYGFTNIRYPLMMGMLILMNWMIAQKAKGGTGGRIWMAAGVILDVGILSVFKYTNFFIDNVNSVFGTDWPLVHLILPLGISFIIFTQISWVVDSFRGETRDVSFREYVLFSVFFPKLSEGPIYTIGDFLPQVRKKGRYQWNAEEVMTGLRMFLCGLSKKLILADPLGNAVSTYFSLFEYRSNVDSLVMMLAYTFQIYFDFSGYSDMAVGVSRMFGLDLPANFNSPYKACTVTDFWRRWHISLTSFLRKYIYFPLGGSRKGRARTYLNIMIVYLVSGLWHGANWTFVLWGLFHGLAQVAERLSGKVYRAVWKPVRWVITFFIVSYLWVLFRCDSFAEFERFRWHFYVDRSWYLSADLSECFRIPGLSRVLTLIPGAGAEDLTGPVSVVLFLSACFFICLCLPNNQERKYRKSAWTVAVSAIMFAVCIMSLSSVSTFLYNDF